eukprot:1184838-Prorocentrum_minimum.AAC.2
MFELRIFGSRVQSESRKLKLGHFEFRTEWTLKWGSRGTTSFEYALTVAGIGGDNAKPRKVEGCGATYGVTYTAQTSHPQAAVVCTACSRCTRCSASMPPTPEVEVTGGTIRGVRLTNGVDQFTGIPFAKPPTPENDGRWREPMDVEDWEGTLNLTDWAPICAQVSAGGATDGRSSFTPDQFAEGRSQGSEDCLYLNVWTDSTNEYRTDANATADLRPVMMFIHGGGFEEGSVSAFTKL